MEVTGALTMFFSSFFFPFITNQRWCFAYLYLIIYEPTTGGGAKFHKKQVPGERYSAEE